MTRGPVLAAFAALLLTACPDPDSRETVTCDFGFQNCETVTGTNLDAKGYNLEACEAAGGYFSTGAACSVTDLIGICKVEQGGLVFREYFYSPAWDGFDLATQCKVDLGGVWTPA